MNPTSYRQGVDPSAWYNRRDIAWWWSGGSPGVLIDRLRIQAPANWSNQRLSCKTGIHGLPDRRHGTTRHIGIASRFDNLVFLCISIIQRPQRCSGNQTVFLRVKPIGKSVGLVFYFIFIFYSIHPRTSLTVSSIYQWPLRSLWTYT